MTYSKIPAGYTQVKKGKIKAGDILRFEGIGVDNSDVFQDANGLIGRDAGDFDNGCYRKIKKPKTS